MNDRRLPVSLVTGIVIATIGLELPVLAVSQPAPMLVAQVACVVKKQTAVYTTANPGDPETTGRTLTVNTAVALAAPLPTNPPTRLQIKPSGFVDYAALDCGRDQPPSTSNSSKTTACRKLRNTINSIYVFREPSWGAKPIAPVVANQSIYVTQTNGVTTSQIAADGKGWVEVDLQGTFGKNFGISPSVGWLPNTNPDPNDQTSTLVNGCN